MVFCSCWYEQLTPLWIPGVVKLQIAEFEFEWHQGIMGSLQHPSHSSYTTTTTKRIKGPVLLLTTTTLLKAFPVSHQINDFMLLSLSLSVQIHPLFPFSFSIFIYFQLIYNIEPTPSRADFGLLPWLRLGPAKPSNLNLTRNGGSGTFRKFRFGEPEQVLNRTFLVNPGSCFIIFFLCIYMHWSYYLVVHTTWVTYYIHSWKFHSWSTTLRVVPTRRHMPRWTLFDMVKYGIGW